MKKLYLFLDIDGVLNDKKYWEKFKKKFPDLKDIRIPLIPFNPKSLRNLKRLNDKLKKENIKMEIVLSSSWRKYSENQYILKAKMIEYGLKIEHLTPIRNNKTEEIKEWLKANFNPQKYIIIDDSNFLNFEDKHFVKTDMNSGFTNKKMRETLKKVRKLYGKKTI